MEQNKDLRVAWDFVENTGRSIFLTGKAGTGKTTSLRSVVERSKKRSVVVAPTGVAAINAGGMTIHSFFQLPLSPYVPGAKVETKFDFRTRKAQDYRLARPAHHRRDFHGEERPAGCHRQRPAPLPRPLPALRRRAVADDWRPGTADTRGDTRGRENAEALLRHTLFLRVEGTTAD